MYWLLKLKSKFRRYILYPIRNLVYWFPVIVSDRDWDSVYILKILHHKLNSMEYAANNYWHWIGKEKEAHRIRIASELCKRLIADDYVFMFANIKDPRRKYHMQGYMENQDWNMLFDILRKHGRKWWD